MEKMVLKNFEQTFFRCDTELRGEPSFNRFLFIEVCRFLSRKTEHPILLPGQCFTYVSGADIDTPTGEMSGSFGAYNLLNHTEFEIPVNKFNLDANAPIRGKCAFTCVNKDEMQNVVFK